MKIRLLCGLCALLVVSAAAEAVLLVRASQKNATKSVPSKDLQALVDPSAVPGNLFRQWEQEFLTGLKDNPFIETVEPDVFRQDRVFKGLDESLDTAFNETIDPKGYKVERTADRFTVTFLKSDGSRSRS